MKTTDQRFKSAFGALALMATAAAYAADNPVTPPSSNASAPPPAIAAPAPPADSATVLSKDEASYLLGVNYGVVMRNYDIVMEIAPEAVNRGFKDGLAGKKATADEQRRVREFIAMVQPVAAQLHAAAARQFLDHNLHEKGVKATATGLQYKILAPGDALGIAPKLEDVVSVQYRGTLLDGTEFDNSYARGTPISIPLSGVIKGWQEGLALMKPGAKWQLFVPPDLGYGKAPRPGIPGGSLLIFEVELLKVIPADSPNAAASGG
jgi:FKBP-type peptidyl-prolyl cis-trans isomerase FklB